MGQGWDKKKRWNASKIISDSKKANPKEETARHNVHQMHGDIVEFDYLTETHAMR